MTDREAVKKDIEELYLGNLGTVEFDLKLPERGKNGSHISWQSGNLNFMSNDGRVSRPSYGRGNREVAMTATFRFGSYEEEKVYLVTVLEENNRIEVDRIYPIRIQAFCGEETHLPCAGAVRTKDGRVISHFLEWEGGLAQRFEQAGEYEVKGWLKDTQIPAVCHVEALEKGASAAAAELPVRKETSCDGFVTLLPGSDFYEAQERVHTYLLHADADQWLYNFRRAAGLPVKGGRPMTGWDAPEGLLRGHSTGHFLSALALCYHATGDERIREKAVYMAQALKECQAAFAGKEGYHPGFLSAYSEEQFDLLETYMPYPKIWAPYYTLHKILAGLLDLESLAGIKTAGETARAIGDWVYERLSRLSHEKRVKMWSIYIAGEYGGMNESMAELYRRTGKEEYLTAARYFDNDRLFYPLEQGVDALDGMHGNQHIPQMVGAMKLYEAAGEERYRQMAELFWRIVTQSHTYAIGGCGESEMFHEPGNITGLLTKSTSESCATYNMLKLTSQLYQYEPDAAYMDYYERAVCNHILSSCDHEPSSGTTYFLSMRPRAVKDFDASENSCCHGTGLESHFKCTENIYFYNAEEIIVNLFIPSRLSLPAETCQAGGAMEIRLETQRERPGRICLRVTAGGNGQGCGREGISCSRKRIRLRRPFWAEGEAVLTVDGIPFAAEVENGYLVIDRQWEGVSEVKVDFSCGLRYEKAPDREDYFTVCYGPYVLAALTEQEERLTLGVTEPEKDFEADPDVPLAFRNRETGIRFIPLEQVWREEYQVYMKKKGCC